MIEDSKAKRFSGLFELFGYCLIILAGRGVSAGMVVHQNNG